MSVAKVFLLKFWGERNELPQIHDVRLDHRQFIDSDSIYRSGGLSDDYPKSQQEADVDNF
jgi:hypothetical protein